MMFVFAVAMVAASTLASNGPAAPPDGSYTYAITQSGAQVGTSTVVVKRSPTGMSISENETIGNLTYTIEETLDPVTLDPRTYVATYLQGPDPQATGTQATGSQTARVVVDPKGATISLDGVAGSQAFPLTSGLTKAYVLELSIMSGFLMLPAQIHASGASQFLQIVPSEVAAFPTRVGGPSAGPRPDGVPANDVELTISSKVAFDEWYDPNTFVLHDVSVPIQNVLIKLTK
jgi:hypothetical protein